jgi:hypothetical protein
MDDTTCLKSSLAEFQRKLEEYPGETVLMQIEITADDMLIDITKTDYDDLNSAALNYFKAWKDTFLKHLPYQVDWLEN